MLLLGELVEVVYSSDALLHDGLHVLGHMVMPLGSSEQPMGGVFSTVENNVGLPAISEEGGTGQCATESLPQTHHTRQR